MKAFLVIGVIAARAIVQTPQIAVVDWYGVRDVDEAELQAALAIEPGDPAPERPAEVEARLKALAGVADARLSVVCCESGGSILYVGIQEVGQSSLTFREPPAGGASLPEEVVAAGAAFEDALVAAVQRGEVGEDDSLGHSLMHDPAARAIQEGFVGLAERHRERLREVLASSADAEQRALAAQVLAYGPDKAAVVPDLVAAMRDPAPGVRNNAMRALAVMAMYARRAPESGIEVPIEPFVDLLSSIVWTDRNKAAFALMSLAGSDDREMLAAVRESALPSLVDMARWRSAGHALPGLILLGRIAGMPDAETFTAFQAGERDKVIAAALERADSTETAR